METRSCRACLKVLPFSDFHTDPRTQKPVSRCKKCRAAALRVRYHNDAEYRARSIAASRRKWSEQREKLQASHREWRLANRATIAAKKREAYLRRVYGVTLEWYAETLESQGGLCASCGGAQVLIKEDGQPFHMAVDHHHESGRVRGLLCDLCNRAVGLLLDSSARAESLADYLRKHGD